MVIMYNDDSEAAWIFYLDALFTSDCVWHKTTRVFILLSSDTIPMHSEFYFQMHFCYIWQFNFCFEQGHIISLLIFMLSRIFVRRKWNNHDFNHFVCIIIELWNLCLWIVAFLTKDTCLLGADEVVVSCC